MREVWSLASCLASNLAGFRGWQGGWLSGCQAAARQARTRNGAIIRPPLQGESIAANRTGLLPARYQPVTEWRGTDTVE